MDQEKIKKVLGGKDYEVNVITSVDGETINGQIATWVTQVSAEPPLMAVCISPTRYTSELINKSGVLAINMLSKEQAALVPHFGYKSGRETDKFAEISYKKAQTGSPILENVSAYLDCKIKQTYDGGDHLIYLAEVVDADIVKGGEKLHYQWLINQS